MARNRQRAKQRQAERRAARLADPSASPPPIPERAADHEELEDQVDLYTGAPPEDTGRSDTVVEHEPPPPDFDTDDEELEEAVDDYEEAAEVAPEKRRRRDGAHAEHHERHHRNRLIAFLIAVWAELQRVEWPNRQTLTLLTGVVLVFVIVMGAYLGLLDAVFSRLINKIL
jgi:preprotein translocase subunit SecE